MHLSPEIVKKLDYINKSNLQIETGYHKSWDVECSLTKAYMSVMEAVTQSPPVEDSHQDQAKNEKTTETTHEEQNSIEEDEVGYFDLLGVSRDATEK